MKKILDIFVVIFLSGVVVFSALADDKYPDLKDSVQCCAKYKNNEKEFRSCHTPWCEKICLLQGKSGIELNICIDACIKSGFTGCGLTSHFEETTLQAEEKF
jgi:hypothetical protein